MKISSKAGIFLMIFICSISFVLLYYRSYISKDFEIYEADTESESYQEVE